MRIHFQSPIALFKLHGRPLISWFKYSSAFKIIYMKPFKIFIVEDDPWYAEILEYHLSLNPDYQVEKFGSGKELMDQLFKKPDVITLDFSLPDMSGEDILNRIKKSEIDTEVIIISGQEDVSTAVKLLRDGAYDYIVKDDETKDRLWKTINNIRQTANLKGEIEQLREEVGKKYDFGKAIIGNSPRLNKVFSLMEKSAKTNITVSVTGETGTGKELVAKAIHYNSNRSKKPFVAVNVAAIPADLIESELFGHEKGAFTGAVTRRLGKFEEATKGTIFLDEIGEMDLNMQTKLLRVLQEREVTRIGGIGKTKIDVRVIVATHKNLSEEVKNGNFREDLYYRLLGLPIELPPLRERGNDVLLLAKFFSDEFCKENKIDKVCYAKEAQTKLLKYPYPGNVRELKAVIELATVMSSDSVIHEEDVNFHSGQNMANFLNEECSLKEYNRRIVKHYLEKYQDDVLLVADKLDIGKSTIYRMLKSGDL